MPLIFFANSYLSLYITLLFDIFLLKHKILLLGIFKIVFYMNQLKTALIISLSF